jgi:hypothetical protein
LSISISVYITPFSPLDSPTPAPILLASTTLEHPGQNSGKNLKKMSPGIEIRQGHMNMEVQWIHRYRRFKIL